MDEVFRGDKISPKNWERYSNLEGSICGCIMKDLVIPFGWGKVDYYEERVAPQVIAKWRTLKTNYQSVIRGWVKGM